MPLNSLEQFRKKHSEFAENSRSFVAYHGPLFKSIERGNYELLKAFTESTTAKPLPPDIRELLGLSEKIEPYFGAFPSVHR